MVMTDDIVWVNTKHSLWVAQQWMSRQGRTVIYREAEAFCKANKCGAKQALTQNPHTVGWVNTSNVADKA